MHDQTFRAAIAVLFLLAGPGAAGAGVREEEIAECRPGELETWGDGKDRKAIAAKLVFSYRHAGAPPWFDATLVEQAINRAIGAWSACGISLVRAGHAEPGGTPHADIVIDWSEPGSRGNFGLANLGQRSLSLGPAAFQALNARNPRHDATQTLQMVISHEMGHFLGLMAHSRRCVDVLSYYDDGRGGHCSTRNPAGIRAVVEYRHILPTACDIQRCRLANQ